MKLWVDDMRPAPDGYVWVKTVNDARAYIIGAEIWLQKPNLITLIDLDHDAGDYANDGGDYIRLLDWLEETGRNYPIRIHSMNPVWVENMRRIIQRNGWTEVQ